MGDRPCQSQVKAKESYPVSPREHGVQLEGGGGRLPHSRVLRHPFPSSPSPRCTISYPPTPYLCRACPSSQVLEFRMLSPLAVPRAPPPNLLLFIRAVEKDFLFLEPNLLLHTAPMPQPHAVVPC
ncbi:plasticity related protein 4, isoform CRA_a [Rattus norvegicus]|uniref:Plasticity related protein 4, isoform CRA_a n=1 Tax=Rattus norvegicus TaxID=10116 RepID=A6JNW3_RAT|nr:plasticity related protein 4, isoform CRA_a [Rattus norvegicus]